MLFLSIVRQFHSLAFGFTEKSNAIKMEKKKKKKNQPKVEIKRGFNWAASRKDISNFHGTSNNSLWTKARAHIHCIHICTYLSNKLQWISYIQYAEFDDIKDIKSLSISKKHKYFTRPIASASEEEAKKKKKCRVQPSKRFQHHFLNTI